MFFICSSIKIFDYGNYSIKLNYIIGNYTIKYSQFNNVIKIATKYNC